MTSRYHVGVRTMFMGFAWEVWETPDPARPHEARVVADGIEDTARRARAEGEGWVRCRVTRDRHAPDIQAEGDRWAGFVEVRR